jgi:hypothetical protein
MTADELDAWDQYREAAARERDLRWERRFASARLVARAALDVLHFGTGKAERLAAAMTWAAPFFLAFLLVGRLRDLPPNTVLLAAFVALFAGFGLLALLGTWGRDEAIRDRRAESEAEYVQARWWREQTAEQWQEADAAAKERAKAEREEREAEEVSRELAEEREAAEAERRYWSEKVECPHCLAKVERRARICKTCRRVVRRAEAERPPAAEAGVGVRLVAALLSAILPGLGHIVRGRILVGAVILLIVFPSVVGCGVGLAGAGLLTGGVGFVLAALLVPLVYLAIIVDSASD